MYHACIFLKTICLHCWLTTGFLLTISKKPARYRRAISYDSKEYYMRLASGNPAVIQDTIEENSEGEATQQEPEHGEDTIARVKGWSFVPIICLRLSSHI